MSGEIGLAQLPPVFDAKELSHVVGLCLFALSFLYVTAIIVLDSRKLRKFVVSKNVLRHLLDGLSFATGIVIVYSIFDNRIFTVVATNDIYIIVTGGTLIFGPILNFMERYDRVVEH